MPDSPFIGTFDPNSSIYTGGAGVRPPGLGFNIPGMGEMGPLANMGLQAVLQSLFPNQVFTFGGQQSFLDTMRYRQQMSDMMASSQEAAARDSFRYRTTFEGGLRLAGASPEFLRRPEVKGWLDRGQATGAGFIPGLAMAFPDLVDRSLGYRGSETVLGQQMYLGGRVLGDPVTGGPGFTPATSRAMAQAVYGQLYTTDEQVMQMRGFGAGQAGTLFREMALRGLVGGEGGGSPGPESPGSTRTRMATGIAQKIKDMTASVAAMREIFGDMGQPDAPMRKLVEGLDALTQGGLAQMRPAQMRDTVRRMQELARMSGIDSGSLFALQARGGAGADAMGLSRLFAADATQGALAYAQAASDTGLTGLRTYGALSKDQILATDQQLRLQAAASPIANYVNAVLYASETFKGRPKMAGSELERFAEAARTGDVDYIRGQGALTPDRLASMFSDAGLDPGTAWSLYNSPGATRRLGAQHGTGSLVRALQQNDVSMRLRVAFSGAFANFADQQGLADQAVQAYWNTDPTKAGTVAGIAEQMGIGVNDPLYNALAVGLARTESMPGGQAQAANLQLFGTAAFRRERALRRIAGNRGILADALSGTGQQGYLRNLVEYINNAGEGATIGGMLASTFSGVTDKDIRGRLSGILSGEGGGAELKAALDKLTTLTDNPHADPAQVSAAKDEVDRLLGQLGNRFGAEVGASNMDPSGRMGALSPEEAVKQYTALRGGVTDADKARLLGSMRGLGHAGAVNFHRRLAAGQYLQTLLEQPGAGPYGPMQGGRTINSLTDAEWESFRGPIESAMPGTFDELRNLIKDDPGALSDALTKEGARSVSLAPGSVVGLAPGAAMALNGTLKFAMGGEEVVVNGDGRAGVGGVG